jgi:hypothetical protein
MTDRADNLSPFGVPLPDAELQRLQPLLGTWSAKGHTRDSVLGPGVPFTSDETFRWLDGSYFLVSTYATTFGSEPTQTGINYWGYDTDAGVFRIIFFSNNGPFTEEGNRYTGRVAGNTLTFEGPARFQFALDDDGKIRPNPDGSISIEWWLRDDHGDWQPWMTNTLKKNE